MTTLLRPAPAELTPAPAPDLTAPAERRWRSRLSHWLAVTGAAAGATSIAFGAPVSPMAVARMVRSRPDGPGR